jgi:RNA polymerase sigma-70 factor (ECF subfamily)
VEESSGTRARDETHWVEEALRGERDAFERLYDRYAAMVHGILLARVPRIDVEDLVQEVFLTVYRRLTTLRDPAAFPGWIAMIARNRATDHLRRVLRTEELPEDLPAGNPSDPSDAEPKAILAVIRSLPEAYRETLVLRLVEGMTGPEIAARTGLTPGSVRVNLHRGWRNCARSSTGEKSMDDRYLLDRSGPADPEVESLRNISAGSGMTPSPRAPGPRRA